MDLRLGLEVTLYISNR
ncbi:MULTISPECIES: pyrroloquinoline quinone precursor peptide PqqA [Klebsiella pneumoniae complex]|nr:pyrroloquinoline quinone precursor peptide PqqA [Klebsiella quasipneumoniae subsp. quasipneumoniae]HBW1723701.1 pyrroloquinoline quinone precursor peptide PqqA [Klebsiella quasipneumoniae subsp. quasipneumoniae]HBW1730271.1 pyrroloquinoline quinone precursor peptide PqqA [Klebsiella quasipneumoniae subsp. quasipneumoniae]HBW1817516.1 pyrroloquinoline quinone precursor peptide PqqA [Klebsiella quasipneumoniae subsp. quasipneumoniae]HCM4045834.1 pyrroloquinoline quinone precursor peptide PqqA 